MAGRLFDRISAKMFWFFYYFARGTGILVFSVEKHAETETWRIKRCSKFVLHCCVFSRIIGLGITVYASLLFWITRDFILNNLEKIGLLGVSVSSIGIIVGQLYFLDPIILWTRRLFRLYRRVQRVVPRRLHFANCSFLALLAVKVLSCIYDLVSCIPSIFCNLNFVAALDTIFGSMYLGVGVGTTFHIASIVYLVLGQLYDVLNLTIREDLCPRLRILNATKGNQKQLAQFRKDFKEFMAIYNEIYKVGEKFQRIFEIPISYTLLVAFAAASIALYHITYLLITIGEFDWRSMIFSTKLVIDVLVLTLSAHRAVKASQVTKRSGLDTVYVRSDQEWETTVEIFLIQLNFYEFKPDLLGLLDISNELILMFLSAIVTYVTFIIQFALNRQSTTVELWDVQ